MSDLDANDKFSAKMVEKFPRYFGKGKYYGGFAIGEGWYQIIETLVSQIDQYTRWQRDQRARDLKKLRAKAKGLPAMIKFMAGKRHEPTVWDIRDAEKAMLTDIQVTPKIEWVQVQQIKEKFGGIRFYYEGGDKCVSGMVIMAESWAYRSCATCGDRGELRMGRWVKTLCDKHEAESQAKRTQNG